MPHLLEHSVSHGKSTLLSKHGNWSAMLVGQEAMIFGTLVPGHDFSAQRIDWGDALEGSARELMAVEQMDMAGEAMAFLADLLRDGPMATREIRAAANAHRHSWRTLNRAKDGMGVKATKSGFEAGWSWRLPPPPKNASDGGEECQQD